MTNDTTTITSIVVHFGQLADPRRSLDRRHYLLDILIGWHDARRRRGDARASPA